MFSWGIGWGFLFVYMGHFILYRHHKIENLLLCHVGVTNLILMYICRCLEHMHPMSLTPFLRCYSVHQHTSGALKFTPSSHSMQPLNGTVHIRVSPQTTFCIHKLAKQTVLSFHVALCFQVAPEMFGRRPFVSKSICV